MLLFVCNKNDMNIAVKSFFNSAEETWFECWLKKKMKQKKTNHDLIEAQKNE